jgi:hypothetical protein
MVMMILNSSVVIIIEVIIIEVNGMKRKISEKLLPLISNN